MGGEIVIFLVSAETGSEALLKSIRSVGRFNVELISSGALARRALMNSESDLVVINTPLPDEC